MATITTLVKDINPGPNLSTQFGPDYAVLNRSGSYFVVLNNNLYFTADDGVHETELWKTDGTEAGTVLVKDIALNGSSSPFWIMEFNHRLYFSADDGIHGFELWRTDGTETGTSLVKDIAPGGSANPWWMSQLNNYLYFSANDRIYGTELWRTDGTETGTSLVKDIAPNGNSNPSSLTQFNGYLYFSADDGVHHNAVWKTDGTAIGTVLVKSVGTGTYYSPNFYGKLTGSSSFDPTHFMTFNNSLYFIGGSSSLGFRLVSIDYDLWKSNGTEVGTALLADFSYSSITEWNPPVLTGPVVFNNDLYCGYGELWKINETQTGRTLVKDINPLVRDPQSSSYSNQELNSNPSNFTVFNGNLYFTADDGIHGRELWKTDGTEAGTLLVKDINPSLQSDYSGSLPLDFVECNGSLYFTANDGTHGTELWKTDGTEAGTVLVADILPGAASSDPSRLAVWNGSLYFWADDGIHGRELWKMLPNHAPSVSDLNKTGASNRATKFSQIDFTQHFSDADGTDHLTQIRITTLPAHGSLYLGNTLVTSNQTIAVQQLAQLTYIANPNFIGTDRFGWNGRDMEDYAKIDANVNLKIHLAPLDPITKQFDLVWVLSNRRDNLKNFSSNSFKAMQGTAQANIIKGGQANDLIQGLGNTDHVWGRRHNDILSGGRDKDYLNGGLSSDLLLGGQGNDVLVGGGGIHSDDVLVGGRGQDQLRGGKGHDYFGFRSFNEAIDQIVDFNHKMDRLLISASGFGGGLEAGSLAGEQFHLGARSQDTMDRFLYDRRTGKLLFDADGVGGVKAIEIAHLTPNTILTTNNFVLV